MTKSRKRDFGYTVLKQSKSVDLKEIAEFLKRNEAMEPAQLTARGLSWRCKSYIDTGNDLCYQEDGFAISLLDDQDCAISPTPSLSFHLFFTRGRGTTDVTQAHLGKIKKVIFYKMTTGHEQKVDHFELEFIDVSNMSVWLTQTSFSSFSKSFLEWQKVHANVIM